MTNAVLSIGSNIGNSRGYLAAAVEELGDCVRAVSSVYRTPPWGGVVQDDFLNAVLLVGDDEVDDPHEWLRRCQQLEHSAARARTVRWGPRTLDADVVAVDDLLVDDDVLTLPHPRAHQRTFVLLPWSEVDPAAELPGFGPITELLRPLDLTGISRLGKLR
ncbi:MAG: 2-amino-4-hydroxy-6-hydroxymethyldihydropteridine diphosphokinase [Actinomycetota bacterium]|nr:2-amino-4-hydroxy-6-hydroxymethyldihydropteridine diphosphokinase [Actinomycetota bacterium]